MHLEPGDVSDNIVEGERADALAGRHAGHEMPKNRGKRSVGGTCRWLLPHSPAAYGDMAFCQCMPCHRSDHPFAASVAFKANDHQT